MVVFRPSDSLSRPRLFVKAERPSPKYSRKLMAFSAYPVERRCLLRRPSDPNRPQWPPTSRCAARRRTLFGKQAKSSESLVNLRGLGKWLFGAKTRLLAVPQAIRDQYGGVLCIIHNYLSLFKAINDPIRWVPNNKEYFCLQH